MQTCMTCQHWRDPVEPREERLCRDRVQGITDPVFVHSEFVVKVCAHPEQTFNRRPTTADGFGVGDDDEYFSALVTGQDFGCIRHQ